MKKTIQFLLVMFFFSAPFLSAQVKDTPFTHSEFFSPSSTKTDFIQQQGYLNKSSLKNFSADYADSLTGFEELKIKADLLAQGLMGEELLGHLDHLKRLFINSKYDLIKNQTSFYSGPVQGKLIGNANTTQVAPCVNEGFELSSPGVYTVAGAVSGWTVSSHLTDGACTPTLWTPGSPEFSLVSTPILAFPAIGNIPNSPLGGTVVALMNNFIANYQQTRLSQNFPVTVANCVFQYAYAGIWGDGGSLHNCCTQAEFKLVVRDCFGNIISCLTPSLNPIASLCGSGVSTYSLSSGTYWTNWQQRSIDLTPYIGSCVTIDAIASDCAFGGHWGCTFFDANCSSTANCANCISGNPAAVNFCSGSSLASIQAPIGNSAYSWTAPPSYSAQIAATQYSNSAISITNAVVGLVFTVSVLSPQGCYSTLTYTLANTQVAAGTNTSYPSCPLGSNGSATVFPTGSGSGYNYTWYNSSFSVVSTASFATNLSAGIYTVLINAGTSCGSVVTTVSVGAQQAYLSVLSNSLVCEGANTGKIVLLYNPGYNSVSTKFLTVTNSVNTPAYTYTSSASANSFTISNLSGGGIYSALIQDGSCSVQLNIGSYAFMTSTLFSLSPQSSTLCYNGNVVAGIVMTGSNTANQLSFNWSPTTYLAGNNGAVQQTTITPPMVPGIINTHIYTVTVTEPSMNCSLGKTITVIAANPNSPTITTIPQICSDSPTFQIIATPSGGLFTNNAAVSSSGIINPPLATTGNNVFTYTAYPAGCTTSTSGTFSISPPLSVSISGNASICKGQSTTLLANGASIYNWNIGAIGPLITVSPTLSMTYSVVGTNISSTCFNMSSITVSVIPGPVLIVTGDSIICAGEIATLMASGADMYTWDNGTNGPALIVSPSSNSQYTVTGTNTAGNCSSVKIVSLSVEPCTAINETTFENGLRFYPNPIKDFISIETKSDLNYEIFDCYGKLLLCGNLLIGSQVIKLNAFENGIYVLHIYKEQKSASFKIIKTD